uniref:WW domain-containing oxidoreductase n=1 Tax=Clastoptera arizonana TaxID=38151 RepID=A0A1B6E0E8_9HEMI
MDSDSEDELPPGWEERATVDGCVYYVNHSTKGTQWTHPRTGRKKTVSGDLPFGWEKIVDNDGKIVFVDHENKRTTYTDPRLAFAIEEKPSPMDIRQQFDGSSTALQVLHGLDLNHRVAIVTGANCGIGFETARALALHGCNVILACRNLDSAHAAIQKIKNEKPNAVCHAFKLDLQSLDSVKCFHEEFCKKYTSLHILILNAGVFGLPYTCTGDRIETTFQVNHLSHFYLTLLFEEQMLKAKSLVNPRIVIVSSESHRFSNLNLDNISESFLSPSEDQYWSFMAYNNSKFCNLLMMCSLSRLWAHKEILAFTVHPGNMVSSYISRNWWLFRLLFAFVRPFTKSLEQAASTTVYCATSHQLDGVTGLYFNNCCRCAPNKAAQEELEKKLWNISISMITSRLKDHRINLIYLDSPT